MATATKSKTTTKSKTVKSEDNGQAPVAQHNGGKPLSKIIDSPVPAHFAKASKATLFDKLRKAAVPDPDLLSIPLDAENAWLMQALDDSNRPKNVPHCGEMARAMRVWLDKDASERWVERSNAMALSDDHKLDGGHRDISTILAFGDKEDWERVCLRLYTLDPACRLMKSVKGDDGKERMVPQLSRLIQMVSESPKRLFEPNPERWATEDCPKIIVSLNVDPHYFQVADQTINERSGADMLATHPTIANELAGIGLSARMAEVVLRSAYLSCYQSWVIRPKDEQEELRRNSAYGSMRKGGNFGPHRFRGSYLAIFRGPIVAAKKLYDAATNLKDAGPSFDLSKVDKVGEVNILTALTLFYLGVPGVSPCDKKEQSLWLDAEEYGYQTFDRDRAIAGIRAMGFATSDDTAKTKSKATAASHLYAECNRPKKRIHIAERTRAIVEIIGKADPACTYKEWASYVLAAVHDDPKTGPNPEQNPSYRIYGPDSSGLPKRLIDKSKKMKTDV